MAKQEHKLGIVGFDHIQVTAPRAREAEARAFYAKVLGLAEIAKPAVLMGRGGAWYRCGDLQLHLGLEDDFIPARKAHPAFRVADLAAMRARLEAAGVPIATDVQIPGYERFEARDPFGNRLEFMSQVEQATGEALAKGEAADDEAADDEAADDEAPNDDGEAIKRRVRNVFGSSAAEYVASPTHAFGSDLARLVELATPQASDHALDVSTGGGHTALALAPHVAHVTATDLTPQMLAAARAHLSERGATHIDYVVADAEHLPFLDASFDIVTVRIAPHHYADVRAAVREMARVLIPGGRLALVDNIAPDDPALDALANKWEQWRDPSHVREYTVSEWRAFLSDPEVGLRITSLETERKSHDFPAWIARTHMPEQAARDLEADMLAAPADTRAYFALDERDGRLVRWTTNFVILAAIK